MNVFHLMQKPGSSTIQALGGLHAMAGWQRPIVTDSGGFQAYSLIRQNPKFGSLGDRGISFLPEGADRKFLLTPEKSVPLQIALRRRRGDLPRRLHARRRFAGRSSGVGDADGALGGALQGGVRSPGPPARTRPETDRPRLFGVVQGGNHAGVARRSAPRRCWRSASTATASAAGRWMPRGSCCARCWPTAGN